MNGPPSARIEALLNKRHDSSKTREYLVLGVIAAATAFFGYRRANGAFEVISFSILLALGLAVHTYFIRNNENPFVAFVRKGRDRIGRSWEKYWRRSTDAVDKRRR